MSRKIIMAGKMKPGIPKAENMQEIIDEVNKLEINKKKKYLYLLASLTILSPEKNNKEIVNQLTYFLQRGEVLPNFSNNKYISNIIDETKKMNPDEFIKEIQELIQWINVH